MRRETLHLATRPALLVALLLLAATGGAVPAAPRDMVAQAIRLGAIPGHAPWYTNPSYAWYSPHQVLVWVQRAGEAEAYMLDTRTGQATLCAALVQAVRSAATQPGLGRDTPSCVLLSPDRKWMVYGYYDPGSWLDGRLAWLAVRLDGSSAVDVPAAPAPYGHANRTGWPCAWLPDSSGWCVLDREGSIGRPVSVEYRLAFPKTPGLNTLEPLAPVHFAPFDSASMLGVRRDWTAVAVIRRGDGAATVMEYSVRGPAAAPVRVMAGIRFPAGAALGQMALSPDGKQIAWCLVFGRPGRRLGSISPPAKGTIELWVSGVRGERMRRVARQPVANVDALWGADHPTDFVWLPKDDGVSFIYRAALYALRLPHK